MIYLNNAASAWPKAPGVLEAVSRSLIDFPLPEGRLDMDRHDDAGECRQRLANLLGGVAPSRIVLTQGATMALNLAILGLALSPGDVVVTSVTEHNSMLRALARLESEGRIQMKVIGLNREGELNEEAFLQAMEQQPQLVALNHASNVTGRVQPVSRFFEQAREAGAITLLDAAQSLGHLPVHPEVLHADLMAFPGHKGLRGPPGTGGLYVTPNLALDQVIVGGTGVRSNLRLHPEDMPMRLEAGTPNLPGLAGLNAALSWADQHGEAFRHCERLRAEQLRVGLRALPRVRLYGDAPGALTTPVVSFSIEGWTVPECGHTLAGSFGLLGRTGLHCAPLIHDALASNPEGTIRFSPSGATTEEEIETALTAVRRLAS